MNARYLSRLPRAFFGVLIAVQAMPLSAQDVQTFRVASPDGQISLTLRVGQDLRWSVDHDGTPVIVPSPIALTLDSGEVLGHEPTVADSQRVSVEDVIHPPIYKKRSIEDRYNQLRLSFDGGYGIELRAYDDGAAYRLTLDLDRELIVRDELASFNFAGDHTAHVPFIRDLRAEDPFISAQEAHYDVQPISRIPADTMAYSPVLVELEDGKSAVILEADLEAYPGMFLVPNPDAEFGFRGAFARYPLSEDMVWLNLVVPDRADYIARIGGSRSLPWRGVVVADEDHELLDSDFVYKLAAPSRVDDTAWIEPGKVAWDWWHDWTNRGIDFRSGLNTETYRFYIDFAAANGLEYIIIDAGWSEPGLMASIPEIDLPEIVAYAEQRDVEVILWAAWHETRGNEDRIFRHYADMGIAGFKVDFIDRDDQPAVESVYHIAERAAAHQLLLDLHGMYKPTGLQRTYPNLINFEGVKGLENVKWTPVDDVPRYDVTAPYIRMLAGPMDYTPGAMRNATQNDFRASHQTPMSHGTRTHQLAMYTVFEAPLQMLADSPTAYMDEQESTDFIAKVPTVFDETVALAGEVGEYLALARRSGDMWFVGAMTNWDARDVEVDLSFLGEGDFQAVIFQDGINADRDARDYERIVRRVSSSDKLTAHMLPGGGWTARIAPAE